MKGYPPWVRVHTRPESPQTPQGLTINVAVHAPQTSAGYDWLFSDYYGRIDLTRLGLQSTTPISASAGDASRSGSEHFEAARSILNELKA